MPDFVLDPGAVEKLARTDEVRDALERTVEAVAANARDLAPGKRIRTAREGIRTEVELTPAGWEGRVGHVVGEFGFWLARQEFGTRYHTPQPHLRPAATMPVDI